MGGNAIEGVMPIKQHLVNPTIDIFVGTIGLPDKYFTRIGSAGKRHPEETSGDIDLAISNKYYTAFTFMDEWGDEFNCRHMEGLNIVSLEWPQSDTATVQIDLMFVDNIDIAFYTYYSPYYNHSKYKGIYRNELMAAMAKCMPVNHMTHEIDGNGEIIRYPRYQWNLNTGLQLIMKERVPRKDGKGYTKKEIITEKKTCFNDLDQMIEFMFGAGVTHHDVMTLEQVINIISKPEYKYYNELEKILETAIGFYNTRKLGVPIEVEHQYAIIKTTQPLAGSAYASF